jgi:hypothetical protein
MLCDEKTALLMAWMQATKAYSEAVANLSHAVGVIFSDDYEWVQRKAATLRRAAEQARERLQEHQRQHNC